MSRPQVLKDQIAAQQIYVLHLSQEVLDLLNVNPFQQQDFFDNTTETLTVGDVTEFRACLLEYVIQAGQTFQKGTIHLLHNGVDIQQNHEYFGVPAPLDDTLTVTSSLVGSEVQLHITAANVGADLTIWYRVTSVVWLT